MQQRRSVRSSRYLTMLLSAIAVVTWAPAAGAEDLPTIPIEQAAGKVGPIQVTLSQRSPLSAPDAVAKRISSKPLADYDLAKHKFFVYIPKSAAADGKFGLMVGLCFKEYGWPPPAWTSVLDQHHLIWISAIDNGDNVPDGERIGLVLDAVSNAQKTWPIDSRRIYLSQNATQGSARGIAFYYSDVFDGMIASLQPFWFYKLRGSNPNQGLWSTDNMPRPISPYWGQAKSHWYFHADRDNGNDPGFAFEKIIYHFGYSGADFEHVKAINVPEAQMGHYVNYPADWFEQGVEFVEQGGGGGAAPQGNAASRPSVAASSAASSDDAAAKAQRALEMAQNYITAQHYDLARTKLQAIVDTYPNTPAARQAAQTLQDIAGK